MLTAQHTSKSRLTSSRSFSLPAEQTDHTFFLCSGTAAPQRWPVNILESNNRNLYLLLSALSAVTLCLRRKRPGDSAACPTHIKKAWSLCARNSFQKTATKALYNSKNSQQASAGGERCRSEALIWRAAMVSSVALAKQERRRTSEPNHE